MSLNRDELLQELVLLLKMGRHVLIEGPVGSGKTRLALDAIAQLGRSVFRVDGDGRYTEQKLAGGFDPRLVLEKGYSRDVFTAGPLVQAMESGGILFLNELNRMPEGVQNLLLPALDEGILDLPRIGKITAAEGFAVVATQNPREFVATSPVSEALLDRMEWIPVTYPALVEERKWVVEQVPQASAELIDAVVERVRESRSNPNFRRGASVRAAIAVAEIAQAWIENGQDRDAALKRAFHAGFANRVELEDGVALDQALDELLAQKKSPALR